MEYLVFVDEIGMTIDGKYLYRFDFTEDTEVVWGEFFNVVPSAIIPNLQPDKNSLTKTGKVIFPMKMELAKHNSCFSMQDCIDGIIPLIFTEIDMTKKPFFIRFGESMDDVNAKLKELGLKLVELEDISHGDDSAIDALIDTMTENNNEDF